MNRLLAPWHRFLDAFRDSEHYRKALVDIERTIAEPLETWPNVDDTPHMFAMLALRRVERIADKGLMDTPSDRRSRRRR